MNYSQCNQTISTNIDSAVIILDHYIVDTQGFDRVNKPGI
jgi:hypothetical protein